MINASHVRVTTGKRRYQPALDANFAVDRSLTSKIGYPWTLTRASKGWDFDATPELQEHATNAARFPYSLNNGSSLGLRIEEQRTNLIGNTNGRWAGYSLGGGAGQPAVSVIAESTPFGSEFLRAVFPTGGSGGLSDSVRSNFLSITSGLSYSVKLWTRNAGASLVFHPTNLSASMELTGRSIGDWVEWERVVSSSPNTSASARITIYAPSPLAAEESIDIAVGQWEQGGYHTTLIPGAAGTIRSGDVATISGADFAAMYREGEGTVVIDFAAPDGQATYQPFSLYYINSDNYLGAYRVDGSGWRFSLGSGSGVTRRDLLDVNTGYVPGSLNRMAYSFSASGASGFACVNGVGSTLPPNITSSPVALALLRRVNTAGTTTGGPYTGYVSRVRYYREKLPDATVQELTTL